jgi:hypothetical protein
MGLMDSQISSMKPNRMASVNDGTDAMERADRTDGFARRADYPGVLLAAGVESSLK